MDQFDVTNINDEWMFAETPEADEEIEEEEDDIRN